MKWTQNPLFNSTLHLSKQIGSCTLVYYMNHENNKQTEVSFVYTMPQCLIFWWISLLLILLHCMLRNHLQPNLPLAMAGQYYFSTNFIFNFFTNKYVLALTLYRKQWLKCALCYLNYRLVKIMACLISPSLYYYHMKSLPSFGGHPTRSMGSISLLYILNFLNWITVIIIYNLLMSSWMTKLYSKYKRNQSMVWSTM